ncbi:diguanylate cyclase [Oxalobacteraceae bacterium R-40]|uniref:Diguanylate cyclase n=1 Tax=Keguizhuia sedimenti TaxID=3064264 RepID=A0ABU1BMK4_9BURK|nr:diguanylate cyclase [Oxalobacteraceae bacterium R-40]
MENDDWNETVLIIDDDEVDRMACRRAILKSRFSKCRIMEAELGEDGIRMIRTEHPAIVLLDYRLPDTDGIEVLRTLSRMGDETPAVVMMTGARDLEIAVESLRLCARDYLVKDAERNYLALLPEILGRIIRERRLIEQKREAEEALRLANQTLEQRVRERTSELEQTNDALNREVSMRKWMSEVLFEERERAMITLSSITDAVFVLNNNGEVLHMNPAAERLVGMKSAELTGKALCEQVIFLEEGSRKRWTKTFSEYVPYHGTEALILIREDGKEIVLSASGGAMHDSKGKETGIVMVLRDITIEHLRNSHLTYQATHDALTGLPNRILFSDRLAQSINHASRNAEKIAILFLDLDGFKKVNDSFGHGVGDNLLHSVADRLKGCLRDGDSLARLGGDEFTMIVSGNAADTGVRSVANKVIQQLTTPFDIEGNELRIGTSVGISIFPDDGEKVDELLEKADAAMYQAKAQGGKSYTFYSPSFEMDKMSRTHLRPALNGAQRAS